MKAIDKTPLLITKWQKSKFSRTLLLLFILFLTSKILPAQVQLPTAPKPNSITISSPVRSLIPNSYPTINYSTINSYSSINTHPSMASFKRYKSQMEMHLADVQRVKSEELRKREFEKDIRAFISGNGNNYTLSYKGNEKGAKFYREAFEKLSVSADKGMSVKESVFIVENAYYEGKKDYSEFEKTIKQTGDFLREKLNELGYNKNSNLAKNFLLFQFFADTLKLQSKNLEHLPLTYDFDDYMGQDNWSKMFVHKLLETGKGQCNSLPRLYMVLAEEINAKAHLAYSPNHTYVKFQDNNNKRKWYNVELTNGMLTTDDFIFQAGFIKAEAIQNKIYMQPLTDKQFMGGQLVELALGYIQKYGYDEFVGQVIDRALQIDPQSIQGHLVKSNFLTTKLDLLLLELQITKENFNKIRNYPIAMSLFKERQSQYDKVDELGYAEMPPEMYQNWLASLKDEKQKQDNNNIRLKVGKSLKN